MSKKVQCVWFKRDLRILDHEPLLDAASAGPVLPVYIVEPEVIHAPDFDAMHWQFIRESLPCLGLYIDAHGRPEDKGRSR